MARVRNSQVDLKSGQLSGSVYLETEDASRGYQAELRGEVEVKDGKVSKLQFVAFGEFWGEGRYTRNAPKGKFPLAIGFTLADGTDIADGIPPQGSRGWLEGYLPKSAAR